MKQQVTDPGHRATLAMGPVLLPKTLEHLREATVMRWADPSFNPAPSFTMYSE